MRSAKPSHNTHYCRSQSLPSIHSYADTLFVHSDMLTTAADPNQSETVLTVGKPSDSIGPLWLTENPTYPVGEKSGSAELAKAMQSVLALAKKRNEDEVGLIIACVSFTRSLRPLDPFGHA